MASLRRRVDFCAMEVSAEVDEHVQGGCMEVIASNESSAMGAATKDPATATPLRMAAVMVDAQVQCGFMEVTAASYSFSASGHAPVGPVQAKGESIHQSVASTSPPTTPASSSHSRFQVGDRVKGRFGTGCVTYIVPDEYPHAGEVEVGGDGRCELYSPAELSWDTRSAATLDSKEYDKRRRRRRH